MVATDGVFDGAKPVGSWSAVSGTDGADDARGNLERRSIARRQLSGSSEQGQDGMHPTVDPDRSNQANQVLARYLQVQHVGNCRVSRITNPPLRWTVGGIDRRPQRGGLESLAHSRVEIASQRGAALQEPGLAR